jgi:ABC-type antimicrobial peptide transport system permease subunit
LNPVKHRGLDDRVRKETLYFPYAQRPVHSITLALRTAVPPTTLVSSVRFTVSNIDPNLPVYQFRTLEERISSSLQRQRTPMVLLSLFGGMALLLATLGVYGTLVFSVSQRTQELGIRMALGAATRDVLGLIMRQGLSLILIGTTLGIVGYAASSRLLQHLLFEVQPLDPFSIGLAVIVLAAVATVACYLPARRATRIDPVVALRDE